MKVSKQQSKYTLVKGSFFLSLPGILSALIALVSIPIYLEKISVNQYSDYLLQHFFLTISIVLNLGLSKISNIEIAKIKDKKNLNNKIRIIFNISVIQSIFISLLIYLLLKFLILKLKIDNLYSIIDIKILFGLFITNIYLTMDSILKGQLYYMLSAFINLVFYSFSISLPVFFCLFFEIKYNFLFNISLFIKLFSLIVLLFFILRKINFLKKIKNDNFINVYINSYKWITINLFFQQIYNYFDKYLIKIFFNNVFFVFYSVSQQIASKLTIPFNGLNTMFLTLNSKSKGNINELVKCLYLYIFLINIIFYMLEPLLDPMLKLWLKKNYDEHYLILSLTFFLIAGIGSLSNMLLDFYDINSLSKKNFKIDLSIFPSFLTMVAFAIYYNSVYFVAFSILLKDIILILIRIFPLNFNMKHKFFIISQIIMLTLIVMLKILNFSYIYLLILHIFIFLKYFEFRNLIFFIKKF